LEECATVTDLEMEDDPFGFESDVPAVYPMETVDQYINQQEELTPGHAYRSPAQTTMGIAVLPAPALCNTHPTVTELPFVAPAARNASATITHLPAQVPHAAQLETETVLKKHNKDVDRRYNAAVKQRRTDDCLDLGASIIKPDSRKPPPRTTKRQRTTPVPLTLPTPPRKNRHPRPPDRPSVPMPRMPEPGEACAHGSAWSDLQQLDHLRHHLKPGNYLANKHCTKCRTPIATVVAKQPLIFYCSQDFRAFNLGPASALLQCHCVVCAPCHASAIGGTGASRRRRRN
jgi:hypothetical protein